MIPIPNPKEVKPLLTLVVPIYNMEQYLPRCMASLLEQTCREYEILLIDDGSTDRTADICDAYAARYPELVRVFHKPNEGPSSARNLGIDHARGEFITFPDPDDWVEPDYVETFLRCQREYQADLVCLGHYVDTDTGSIPSSSSVQPTLLLGREGQRGLLLPPSMHGFSWNKLYRMDLIRAHGLRFPPEINTTEDLWFAYLYLAHCSRVCHAPAERVYHYCQRADSFTNGTFAPEKLETVTTYEYIISDCADRDPELARQASDELCTAAVNLLWLHENAAGKSPETRRYLLSYIRRLLPGYLQTTRYGMGRKLQTLLAAVSPRVFCCLKNLVHKRSC